MPGTVSSTINVGDISISLPDQSINRVIDQSVHLITNQSTHQSMPLIPNPSAMAASSINQPINQPTNQPTNQSMDEFFPEVELSNTARMASATIGALITSFVVTPFDVVKTRLQAQVTITNPSINQSINQSIGQKSQQTSCANPQTAFSNKSINQSTSTPLKHIFAQLDYAATRPTNQSINPSTHQHLSSQALLDRCSHVRLQTGFVETWCHKCTIIAPRPSVNQLLPAYMAYPVNQSIKASTNHQVFTGTFDCLVKLIKYEGVSSLWRGLSPQLLLSIPSTVVYFGAYDRLKAFINQSINQSRTAKPDYHLNNPSTNQSTSNLTLNHLTPLLAGTSARALTTILVSPIELIRTKAQSINQSVRMRELVKFEIKKGGFWSLWRGANPTLWRDVPFSAIYWSTYEHIKDYQRPRLYERIKRHQSTNQSTTSSHNQSIYQAELMKSSFFAGAFSGILASTLTHPFDLVKTRRQIEMYALIDQSIDQSVNQQNQAKNSVKPSPAQIPKHNVNSTLDVLKLIVREEGWVGLTTGMPARVSKIAPACAIMISSYEVAKAKFGHIKGQQHDQAPPAFLNELK